MDVSVWVQDRPAISLAIGDEVILGRDPGPGQIAEGDRAVSRRHGIIAATIDGWAVQSIGSRAGLVVYDHETPSVLHIPRGVGPVVVPFAVASVVVEVAQQRYAVTVKAAGSPGWAGSWSSVLGQDPGPDSPAVTRLPWDGVRWLDVRTGRPLRWYQTLVALCEPHFQDPPTTDVPTDAALARRLGVSVGVVESKLIGMVRAELGFPPHTPNLRQTMVSVAIGQRLVTSGDLSVLDVVGSSAVP